MKEALRRISAVYYAMYSGTIVLSVIAYFLNFKGIVIALPEQGLISIVVILYLILMAVLLAYFFYKFYENNKKCLRINDRHEMFELYIHWAKLRLYVSGLLLIVSIILFYSLRSMDLLYGIAISAVALLFSKPTENKIANDLKLDIKE